MGQEKGMPEFTERVFAIVVRPDEEDGGFNATVPTLPGVVGQGETEEAAARDARDALFFTVEDMEKNGEPLPESDESARTYPPVPNNDYHEHRYRAEMAL